MIWCWALDEHGRARRLYKRKCVFSDTNRIIIRGREGKISISFSDIVDCTAKLRARLQYTFSQNIIGEKGERRGEGERQRHRERQRDPLSLNSVF